VHLQNELGTPHDAAARLAALGDADMLTGLRLSKKLIKAIYAIREASGTAQTPAVLGHQMGEALAAQAISLRHAMFSTPLTGQETSEIYRGARAKFPVKSSDLSGDFQGKALGDKLKKLQVDWYASDLTATRAQLLG